MADPPIVAVADEDENDAFQVKRMMIERRDDGAFAFADGNRTRATTSTMSSSSFSLLCSFVSKSEGKWSPLRYSSWEIQRICNNGT